MFKSNIGEADRVIRLAIAAMLIVFSLIAGHGRPTEGDIRLGERSLLGLSPDRICRLGIARTFQIVKPFAGLTVHENVTVGALNAFADLADARAKAAEVLQLLGLWAKRDQPASSLTLPDRKRLEVARALGTGPQLLLLDEVMAGLRPTETDQMVAVFRQLNEKTGLTILLIEHVMRAVMALARRIVVLHHGQHLATGTPSEIRADQKVIEAYLGHRHEH